MAVKGGYPKKRKVFVEEGTSDRVDSDNQELAFWRPVDRGGKLPPGALWLERNLLVYLDTKKGVATLRPAGLQLPLEEALQRRPDIPSEWDAVNDARRQSQLQVQDAGLR